MAQYAGRASVALHTQVCCSLAATYYRVCYHYYTRLVLLQVGGVA